MTGAEFAVLAAITDAIAGLVVGCLASPRGRLGPFLATMFAFLAMCTWCVAYSLIAIGMPLGKVLVWTAFYSLFFFLSAFPAGIAASLILRWRGRQTT